MTTEYCGRHNCGRHNCGRHNCGRHDCRHHGSSHGQPGCIGCPMKNNGDPGCPEFHEAASETPEAYGI